MMTMDPELEVWLQGFLREQGGIAGTVHERVDELLYLRAHVNIPPPVVKVTETIPKGKGMAGLAWERDKPVATCDLQSDNSGDVRPGAKAVEAQAALAIPVRDPGGELRAVVGIAFKGERDFSDAELKRYEGLAARLPKSG